MAGRTRTRYVFSVSFVLVVALITLVAGTVVGRASTDSSGGGTGSGAAGRVAGTRVDVIIKAVNSSFWQAMLAGARQAGQDFGLQVELFGPPAETDVDEQIQLVENSISRGVDAIVLAPNSSTALNGVIDRAREAGIKVIIVDNAVGTESDGFIGTDNLKAGAQAGRRLCELVKENGHTSGNVMIESSVAGVQVLEQRDQGFEEGLAESCPELTISVHRYNNNDIQTGAAQVNDVITADPNLVGIFADNNMSGNAAARAIKDNNAKDRIPVVAFDTDPQEVAALKAGQIDALVVQNPYFFGYQGVIEGAMAVVGSDPPANLDPGAVVADRENMNDPQVKALLTPPTASIE